MLSNVTYKSLSGTSVPRDFVELPSQVMENWAADSEVLKMYAKHYVTGEPIPDALIAKLEKAGTFGQGFETVEYLSSSLLDMEYYATTAYSGLAEDFENKRCNRMPNSIVARHKSNCFSHVWRLFTDSYICLFYY